VENRGRPKHADFRHFADVYARWQGTWQRNQNDPSYKDQWWDQQCGMCEYWIPLSGVIGMDYGACSCPKSNRDGRITFEHDGCDEHEKADEWRVADE
jgi:hypothetical protein